MSSPFFHILWHFLQYLFHAQSKVAKHPAMVLLWAIQRFYFRLDVTAFGSTDRLRKISVCSFTLLLYLGLTCSRSNDGEC